MDGDAADYTRLREEIASEGATLSKHEERWRNRQTFLESKGYMLRSRLRPGWVPSWMNSTQHPVLFEDFQRLPFRPNLVDATRISDRRLVYIKRVATDRQELKITQLFNEKSLREDPHNHSVPTLDVFLDDEDPAISYVVMPFLRPMDNPPFSHVGDVLEFIDQVLEGVAFMHDQGVAHRNCAQTRLMMDAAAMYPRGFHPVQQNHTVDLRGLAPVIPRLGVWPPVRYYFVDHSISVRIPDEDRPQLVIGHWGSDQDVPELSVTVPYDPFKVDIFVVGNMLKKQICKQFVNFECLVPLAEAMTVARPMNRPNADDALALWRRIRATVPLRRSAPLRRIDDEVELSVTGNLLSSLSRGVLVSRRMLAWATHKLRLNDC